MDPLGVACGIVVGFALGLTGGGGSIFAVPLLIYGLGVAPREAVGASLAAVGATAFVGFLQRLWRREVEIATGLLFAVTGAIGAPLGAWLNSLIPSNVLLVGFSLLMFVVAARMWRKATASPQETKAVRASWEAIPEDEPGPVCRRDPEGRLHLTTPCGLLLAALGFCVGILSGLFGVGGGFVIVPALVLFSGMGIHRAVATSLMVISLIGASGVSSYVIAGRPLDLALAAQFALGGVIGMLLGGAAASRISGPRLQKIFSAAIVAVALFIAASTLLGLRQ